MRRKLLSLSALFLTAIFVSSVATSCASRPEMEKTGQQSGTEWDISSTEEALAGDDPAEGFNRAMFYFNDALMQYVMRPVSWIYGGILPLEAVYRIDNVADNLAFPGRMMACFLQGRWAPGGIEASRFFINTTIGVAGIFDPASHYWGLERRHENMGQAFRSWGFGEGCYFILPLCTATNPRDCVGALFDTVLDGKFYIPLAGYIGAGNKAIYSLDAYLDLAEYSQDPYEMYKMYLLARRYAEIRDYPIKFPEFERRSILKVENRSGIAKSLKGEVVRDTADALPADPFLGTINAERYSMDTNRESMWIKTSPWNTGDFINKGKTLSVKVSDDAKVKFKFWKADEEVGKVPDNGELVIIVPGVGAHYSSAKALAAAEFFTRNGYSAVTVSNAMNWDFAKTEETLLPGYVPEDAEHTRKYLASALQVLKDEEEFTPKKITVVGFSLGGLYALHMASQEEKDDTLGGARFVAVNPPCNPMYSFAKFDEWSGVTKEWTKEEYFNNLGDVAGRAYTVFRRKHPFTMSESVFASSTDTKERALGYPAKPDKEITSEQVAVLFTMSLRMSIRELLANYYKAHPEKAPVEFGTMSRTALYKEIDKIGANGYVEKFLLEKYKGKSREDLVKEASAYAIKGFLKKSDKVRVIHTVDDPLISEKDVRFLDDTLGGRIVWFERGGHMGDIILPEFEEKLLDAVRN